MKKLLVVLLVALCAVFTVNAIGPEFGVKAGLTMGNMVWGDQEPSEFDKDMFRQGLTGGIMMEIPLGPLSLGAEALYTQKGEKEEWDFGEGDVMTWTYKLDYIEVPVMAKLALIPMLKIYGGVSFGFLTKAEVEYEWLEETETYDMKDFMNKTEMGAIFGAQVKISQLILDARFNMGLTDIRNEDLIEGEMNDIVPEKLTLRTISLTAGIMF